MQRSFARKLASCAFLMMLLVVAPAMALEPLTQEVEYTPDIEYGTGGDVKLQLDLAKPQGIEGPLPGLILIHGGGWTGGKRQDFSVVAQELAKYGYVAATITYRLAPQHQWPAQIEDCKCAVRWMRAHAEELGVDPQRIGVLGGSAGGHLALLLGVMDESDGLEGTGGWEDQSSRVHAVIDFFGPADLFDEFDHQRRGQPFAAIANQEVRVLEDFLGGTPDDMADRYREASPITYVTRGDAPTLILQGTHDVLVPYPQSVKMAAALARRGVPGRMELLFGAGHGWDGAEMDRTKLVVVQFLNQYLDN